MVALVACMAPTSACKSADFPTPTGPTTQTNCPGAKVSSCSTKRAGDGGGGAATVAPPPAAVAGAVAEAAPPFTGPVFAAAAAVLAAVVLAVVEDKEGKEDFGSLQ